VVSRANNNENGASDRDAARLSLPLYLHSITPVSLAPDDRADLKNPMVSVGM
jgi:hypothetical protein